MSTNEEKVKENSCKIPLLLRPWVNIYSITPKILPFFNIDTTFTILSAVIFCLFRNFYLMMLLKIGWPYDNKATRSGAAGCVAITHSSILEIGLFITLLSQPYRPNSLLKTSPIWYQQATNALMEFCTGYMIYDSLYNVFYECYSVEQGAFVIPVDKWCYFGHHIATITYMTTVRMAKAGHISAMILMFTGEFTNPFHNALYILDNALLTECCATKLVVLLQEYVQVIFSILYIFFRIFVGPGFSLHLTYDILLRKEGRKNVPVLLGVCWMICAWGVLGGSIPWIYECISFVQTFYEKKFASSISQEL